VVGKLERSKASVRHFVCDQARADIADIALDHFIGPDEVNITDKLDVNFPTRFATERKVFVPNVLIPLQRLESGLIRCNVLELTNLPESLADHVFEWIVEQIEQKGIYIDYLAGVRVEYQNAVVRSFKQPPIAKL
jgi:hypothetical protein